MNKSVLTIASGKPVYIEMAVNLARSFLYWHTKEDIHFFLATDKPDSIPADVAGNSKFHTIPFEPGQYGESFSTKLFLDKFAQTNQTLFIDADCLLTGSLVPIFEKLSGHAVAVVGRPKSEGDWFGDVGLFCKTFSVPSIPGFNGCLYYLEKGETSSSVYAKARELEPQYEQLGMKLLRGKPNDELLMSVSMAIHGLPGILDDGSIYGDPLASPGQMRVDVLSGVCKLINPLAPNPLHRDWYPFYKTQPVIMHFLGNFTEHPPYTSQVWLLKAVLVEGIPLGLARLIVWIKLDFPWTVMQRLKKVFRPIYHAVWGYRKVKKSKRV
jgi:hypothetical protein